MGRPVQIWNDKVNAQLLMMAGGQGEFPSILNKVDMGKAAREETTPRCGPIDDWTLEDKANFQG